MPPAFMRARSVWVCQARGLWRWYVCWSTSEGTSSCPSTTMASACKRRTCSSSDSGAVDRGGEEAVGAAGGAWAEGGVAGAGGLGGEGGEPQAASRALTKAGRQTGTRRIGPTYHRRAAFWWRRT